MASGRFAEWRYYWYNPSLPGGIIYTILFAMLFFAQFASILYSLYLISRKRPLGQGRKIEKDNSNITNEVERTTKSKFKSGGTSIIYILFPFFIGLGCEFIGHIGRAASHDNIWSKQLYIMQTLLMLIAPPLFSATLYMVFGRLVTLVLKNEEYLLLYPRFITKVCVAGDVLSLFLQAIGGGILATVDSNPDNYDLGQNVILGGLAVQILFFGFFVLIEVTYFVRLNKNIHKDSYNSVIINERLKSYPNKWQNWKQILVALFLCSVFILIRSVFRIVEFTEGNGGFIARHEWFIYVFDSLMMFLNGVLFVAQDVSSYFLKAIPVTWEQGEMLNDLRDGNGDGDVESEA